MSGSSPDDLSIAFRSVTRRLLQARGTAPDDVVAGPVGEVHDILRAAAALMGSDPAPDAIADSIQRRPASDWTDALLDELRTLALALGNQLRHVATLAEQA
ncbi:MAG: hypothetical protein WCI22_05800 [Actinomycetota bacterium]